MQLWEHFWNIIHVQGVPKNGTLWLKCFNKGYFWGHPVFTWTDYRNISWHSHVSSLSFLHIQFSVDQIFPWILQCGCCCWPSIGEQINIGLESFSWEMMSMQHNQGTLNGRREVNAINLLTDNHLCLAACVLTQSINWKTSIFAMIKPIKSRDKDACDISSQGGMCCCCDGLKLMLCSFLQFEICGALEYLISHLITPAWPAQLGHSGPRPGMGLCQNIFNI